MLFTTTLADIRRAREIKQHSKRTRNFNKSSVNLTNKEFLQTIKENWAFAQYTLKRKQVEDLLNDPIILKLDIKTIDHIIKKIEGN